MIHVVVKIHRLGDPPAFPELIDTEQVEGELTHVTVLEGGTVEGNTSLGLDVKLPDGSYVFVQVTGRMWNTIAAVVTQVDALKP